MTNNTRYVVRVDTGGSIHSFITREQHIFTNFLLGNTPGIFFKTIDGKEVFIPSKFMVTHEEESRGSSW